MKERIVITGIGIISSVGVGADATLRSLAEGKTGIGPLTLFDSVHAGNFPVAEVKIDRKELARLAREESPEQFTRTTLFARIAALEAMEDSGWNQAPDLRSAVISGTTVGGMDRTENFYRDFSTNRSKGKLKEIAGHVCADSTVNIATLAGKVDFLTTVNTACSSSVNSIIAGVRLIRSGMVDRVLAGGTDCITKFTLNGFNTLMILDRHGCKPFDEHRAGLTLGEGAAYVVLEKESDARHQKKDIYAEISGYCNANDAFHQTASSPDGSGAWLAMKGAVEKAGILPAAISYINVHGTGTVNNDLSEGIAMERLFAGKVPDFSSTKGFTGHTLGAAGSIESVISLLALKHQIVFPNPGFSEPMKEINIAPMDRLKTGVNIRHVMSNSFGFGGNNSSIIFSIV